MWPGLIWSVWFDRCWTACVCVRSVNEPRRGASGWIDRVTTLTLGNNESQWGEEHEHTSSPTTTLIIHSAPPLFFSDLPAEGVTAAWRRCRVSMPVLWGADRFDRRGCYADGCLCSETRDVRDNTSERPPAAVRGRLMMTSRFSCFCVCGQRRGQGQWVTATTHTHNEDAQMERLYFDATLWCCRASLVFIYRKSIKKCF